MKNKINFYTLLALVLITSGNSATAVEQQSVQHSSHHGQANANMQRMDFDQLVARFEAPGREEWQKPQAIIKSLGNLKGKTVVEIGSGTGYFSFRLAETGAHVVAADVDERFQEYVRQRKAALKLNDDALVTRLIPYDSPQLDKEEADIVLLVDVYHHIENREHYFRQVRPGIKPQGKLVIVDFKLIATPDGPPLSMRIPPEQMQAELKAAGFNSFTLDNAMLSQQYILIAQ
jgi:2-polyprenyl-3-methyl-5-hydroxy-6-metoxy-1,4-benzoquinol methylase